MKIRLRHSWRRRLRDNRGRLLGMVAVLLIALAGLLNAGPAASPSNAPELSPSTPATAPAYGQR